MTEVTVTEKDKGRRLDLMLVLAFPQYSRTNARKLLDMGKVSVNQQTEYRPNYKVSEGDVLSVATDIDMQRKRLEPYEFEVEILYRDKNIVIVNKPEGLIVHPTTGENHKSLLNAMYYMLGDELTEYGINLVNRIDKGTSGIVVLAISPEGAWHYAKQFAEGEAKKFYLAVVRGRWGEGPEKKVSGFLRYNHIERRQYFDREGGEYAETIFSFLDYDRASNTSLIEAKPVTGRTHQIRAQLAELGYPIIGDTKYGGEAAARMMLHAHVLKLHGLSGEQIKVEAPPPPGFTTT